MRLVVTLSFLFLLSACSGEQENSSPPVAAEPPTSTPIPEPPTIPDPTPAPTPEPIPEPPPIIAIADVFNNYWQDSMNLSILDNDTFDSEVSIVIVEQPVQGELTIDGTNVLYTPYQKQSSTDHFTYQLKQQQGLSNNVTVEVTLKNRIEKIEFLTTDPIVQNEQNQLHIQTLLPLSANDQITVQRFINNVIDLDFVPSSITSQTNTDFIIDYQAKVSALPGKYEQSHQLSFRLKDDVSNTKIVDYRYYALPDPSILLTSIKGLWFNETEYQRVVNRKEFALSWTNFPIWDMPLTRTWTEDPFSNNTWLLYYHSLGWLFAYEYAYEQTNDEQYLDIITETIIDYLQISPRQNPISYMSWNDHTIALRTDLITYFYLKYLKSRITTAQHQIINDAIAESADELHELIQDDRFFAHNHSMFHAFSLFNLSHAFPLLNQQHDYRQIGLNRIFELYNEMVNVDTGVSIEQSSAYQMLSLDLFIGADKLIKRFSQEENPLIREYVAKILEFTTYLTRPDGSAPIMGDSDYADTKYLNRLNHSANRINIVPPELEFIRSKGAKGTPLDKAYTVADDGYSILRPHELDDWDKQSHIFVDFGKKRFSHGHHDAGNILLFLNGEDLLVDSGGPFKYDAERIFYTSKYAHNALIIDDVSLVTEDAQLHLSDCQQGLCYSVGRVIQDNIIHTRAVLATEGVKPQIYILDFAHNPETSSQYELLYHFPIDATITPREDAHHIQLTSGNEYSIKVLSNQAVETQQYTGHNQDGYKQGWVTPKFAKEVPAPVLSYTSEAQTYWAFTEVKQGNATDFTAALQQDNQSLSLNFAGFQVFLGQLNSANPSITINP